MGGESGEALIDRVFLPRVTFQYIEGEAPPKPLTKGRKARVVITSDTPTVFLKWIYGNGWVKVLRRQILASCGFSDLKITYHAPVRGRHRRHLRK